MQGYTRFCTLADNEPLVPKVSRNSKPYRWYLLSPEQWRMIEALCKILQVSCSCAGYRDYEIPTADSSTSQHLQSRRNSAQRRTLLFGWYFQDWLNSIRLGVK